MNIYELLQKIIVIEKQHKLLNRFPDDEKQKLETETDKNAFNLLRNIYSLSMGITEDGVKFSPYIIWEGKRSFSLEDMTDDDYTLLSSLDLHRIPLPLRARIADILWIHKKDYKVAVLAAEAYYELFNVSFTDDDWVDELDFIRRSIFISVQIKENEIYNKCCQTVYDHIIRIDVQKEDFLLIKLIEIITKEGFGDTNVIINIIDRIIVSNKENPHKIECAYSLKVKNLHKLKKTEEARQANIELANYYVDFAENIFKNEKMGVLKSVAFFQKAIIIYRNNGDAQTAEKTHKRLIEVQCEIPKLMVPHTSTIDISNIVKNIKQNMHGLSFEESIIRLTQTVPFYKKEDIKQEVIKNLNSHIHLHLCSQTFVNESGQTILVLEPLDLSDPEKDPGLLDKHIHRKMYDTQKRFGDIYLIYILNFLKENFSLEKENLDFLICNNAIIPSGREDIIRSGLYMALTGDFYEALHILAPQVENVFRNIAKEVGGLTITLGKDGTSKEKVLSSIFDLPELIDCYDNNILFMFEGLLNKQTGANIRNNIAHGLMDESNCRSGANIYFICAVIKLLALYSPQVYEILAKSNLLLNVHHLPQNTVEGAKAKAEDN